MKDFLSSWSKHGFAIMTGNLNDNQQISHRILTEVLSSENSV